MAYWQPYSLCGRRVSHFVERNPLRAQFLVGRRGHAGYGLELPRQVWNTGISRLECHFRDVQLAVAQQLFGILHALGDGVFFYSAAFMGREEFAQGYIVGAEPVVQAGREVETAVVVAHMVYNGLLCAFHQLALSVCLLYTSDAADE